MTEQWMSMGKTALDAGKYDEAYDYFSRAVNINPNNYEAVLNQGIAAGMQSTWYSPRIDEFFQGANKSLDLLMHGDVSEEHKSFIPILYFENVYSFFEKLLPKMKAEIDKKDWFKNGFEHNTQVFLHTINIFLRGVSALEEVLSNLSKVYKNDYEFVQEYELKYKKALAKYLLWVCEPVKIPHKESANGTATLGIPDDNKKEFISQYKKILDEIKQTEKEYQQKLYWEQHPEEYKAHLFEEEKRRKEELEKQRIEAKRREEEREKERKLRLEKRIAEIGEEISQLKETVQKNDLEVDQLTKERESLGMFAFGKKKEIDNKLSWLEDNNKRAQSRIESLRKQLLDLDSTRR